MIVLRYLDDHLLNASVSQRLINLEIKYVVRRILEALKVLHEDNFVHTDVQLADCGSMVPSDSAYAKDGDLIGDLSGGALKRSSELAGAHKQTYGPLAPYL